MNLGGTKIEHTEPFAALLGHWSVHRVWLTNSSAQALERGVPGLLSGSVKCAQLGCSWEHLAGACSQPTHSKDGAAGDAPKLGRGEQDPHVFLYETPGEMRLFRVTDGAEVSLTCCPLPRHGCSLSLAWVSLHSYKEHLLFALFFTAVVCTTLLKQNHKVFPNNLCGVCSKLLHSWRFWNKIPVLK